MLYQSWINVVSWLRHELKERGLDVCVSMRIDASRCVSMRLHASRCVSMRLDASPCAAGFGGTRLRCICERRTMRFFFKIKYPRQKRLDPTYQVEDTVMLELPCDGPV